MLNDSTNTLLKDLLKTDLLDFFNKINTMPSKELQEILKTKYTLSLKDAVKKYN